MLNWAWFEKILHWHPVLVPFSLSIQPSLHTLHFLFKEKFRVDFMRTVPKEGTSQEMLLLCTVQALRQQCSSPVFLTVSPASLFWSE